MNIYRTMNDVYSPSGNSVRGAVIELLKILVAMAEVEYPEPNWVQAPIWANWYTIDKDGTRAWFAAKPYIHDGDAGWSSTDSAWENAETEPLQLGCDWRLTLRQRPSQQ